jgi:REP element-mobilizing transposase RayT
MVFSTKDRQPFITPEFQKELCPYTIAVLRDKGNLPIQVNAVEDHMHLLFSLCRTIEIAEIVDVLKTNTSKLAKRKSIRDFAWQAGYGVFSVGLRDVDIEIAYIKNQQQHHHKLDYQAEFRTLMSENGIEIDERYVWD